MYLSLIKLYFAHLSNVPLIAHTLELTDRNKNQSEFALFTTTMIVSTKSYYLFSKSTSYSINQLKRFWKCGWLNSKYWPSFVKRKTLLLLFECEAFKVQSDCLKGGKGYLPQTSIRRNVIPDVDSIALWREKCFSVANYSNF